MQCEQLDASSRPALTKSANEIGSSRVMALERMCSGRLLSQMPDIIAESDMESAPESPPTGGRSLWDRAMATGSLTTIATGGALIGLGMRDGETSRVFRLAGRGLLERAGVASSTAPLTSVGIGYLHHLLIATVWGACLAVLILPLKGVARIAAAVLASVMYVALSVSIVPAALRIGYSVTSSVTSAVSVGVSLLVALLGGIWLAATESPG